MVGDLLRIWVLGIFRCLETRNTDQRCTMKRIIRMGSFRFIHKKTPSFQAALQAKNDVLSCTLVAPLRTQLLASVILLALKKLLLGFSRLDPCQLFTLLAQEEGHQRCYYFCLQAQVLQYMYTLQRRTSHKYFRTSTTPFFFFFFFFLKCDRSGYLPGHLCGLHFQSIFVRF